ncbi:MAG: molybdopterin-binding protein [Tissierellia bacterium]|nr:molybdopterin-binding protein [Tissierellia bacterium]
MGKVRAVCISDIKGIPKTDIESAILVENHGIENDSHSGKWHRQISLLSYDSVRNFESLADFNIENGAFGENILVEGIDLSKLPVGTILKSGDIRLEVTQIGKECHHGCEIRTRVGDCIMPREGIFARVLKGGMIKKGDDLDIEFLPGYRFAVLTVSDKASIGQREDKSGDLICKILEDANYKLAMRQVVPDERDLISKKLKEMSDEGIELILTTGGTGFSKRDITPEATLDIIERQVPGIPEAMRAESMKITNRAMLSRAVAGIRKSSLIINLPGSPKAVKENIEVFLPVLDHAIEILTGIGSECAR